MHDITAWQYRTKKTPMRRCFLLILYAGIKVRYFYVNITERGPLNSLPWLDLTQSMGGHSQEKHM